MLHGFCQIHLPANSLFPFSECEKSKEWKIPFSSMSELLPFFTCERLVRLQTALEDTNTAISMNSPKRRGNHGGSISKL